MNNFSVKNELLTLSFDFSLVKNSSSQSYHVVDFVILAWYEFLKHFIMKFSPSTRNEWKNEFSNYTNCFINFTILIVISI